MSNHIEYTLKLLDCSEKIIHILFSKILLLVFLPLNHYLANVLTGVESVPPYLWPPLIPGNVKTEIFSLKFCSLWDAILHCTLEPLLEGAAVLGWCCKAMWSCVSSQLVFDHEVSLKTQVKVKEVVRQGTLGLSPPGVLDDSTKFVPDASNNSQVIMDSSGHIAP